MICAAEECDLPRECREWCMKHYMRVKRTGTAEPGLRRPNDPDATDKWCRACKVTKPISEFSAYKTNRDGKSSYCRPCESRDKRRRALWSKYKITLEDWQEMFDTQGGSCAICREKWPLVVDHDHSTGAVRGLLCQACNKMLGSAFDDPRRLRVAADYVGAKK